jgi:hypothetical protein
MEIVNFDPVVKGNTFNQVLMTFPFDITGACITMQFRNKVGGKLAFEWSTEDNTISVISATEIYLLARIMNYPAYTYYYDFTVVLPSGVTYTYFEGTLTITQNISEGCQV